MGIISFWYIYIYINSTQKTMEATVVGKTFNFSFTKYSVLNLMLLILL